MTTYFILLIRKAKYIAATPCLLCWDINLLGVISNDLILFVKTDLHSFADTQSQVLQFPSSVVPALLF